MKYVLDCMFLGSAFCSAIWFGKRRKVSWIGEVIMAFLNGIWMVKRRKLYLLTMWLRKCIRWQEKWLRFTNKICSENVGTIYLLSNMYNLSEDEKMAWWQQNWILFRRTDCSLWNLCNFRRSKYTLRIYHIQVSALWHLKITSKYDKITLEFRKGNCFNV